LDYDETRGVPLRAHIYMRATAAAWTRYRQEWSYYLHSAIESSARVEPIAMPFDRAHADETILHPNGWIDRKSTEFFASTGPRVTRHQSHEDINYPQLLFLRFWSSCFRLCLIRILSSDLQPKANS